MIKGKKLATGFVSLSVVLMLAACGGNGEEASPEETAENNTASEESTNHSGDHTSMDHSGSGEVPEGLKVSENPKYEVGSKAIITHGHMEGMEGAEATIVGAYDTTVYTISYTPTTGGERVENHKWVVHQEIANAKEEPFAEGDEVKVNASHMEGMEGAAAEIDSAEEMTVYMVDFTTTDGEEVTNHMWVTETELSPAE
ncbi:YdhK family protein [Bacillus sp. ISL-47]|uniref:YdhK family protein n=1 Tax=Bacillus sp. ISL-47 TaxID=2819130 RepID=UPI001BE7742C|nr:YdhK family protein [Bacillus sp. ISL-47]MBT2690910.1 YdhK family protein [Bacillus sp. ISL-47]MBT2710668.1 YdhK family protein [Pseudomonas sp. ISL-84]